MSLDLFFSDIGKYVAVNATDAPQTMQVYRVIGRTSTERLTNKDVSDSTNRISYSGSSPFTVSNSSSKKAAYTSVQEAIDAAAATGIASTVLVGPGTYTEDIILRDKVNLEGSNPLQALSTHVTVFTGNISANLAAGGETVISKIAYTPVAGNAFTASGSAAYVIVLNGVLLKSADSSPSVIINNSAMNGLFNMCIINGLDVILRIDACAVVGFRGCALGNLFVNPSTGRILISNVTAALSMVYCVGQVKFEVTSSTFVVVNSFFTGGAEMAALTSTNMIMTSSTYLSFSPGNLITGTGTFQGSSNNFLGRNIIASGVSASALTFDPQTAGIYTPTITENSGLSSSAIVSARYVRSGFGVKVTFRITYTGSDTIDADFNLTLPFDPSSNFSSVNNALGSAVAFGATDTTHGTISAVNAAKRVNIICRHTSAVETVTTTGSFSYSME
jgi:hypothetical protein